MADYNKDDLPRRDYGKVGEKTAEGRVLRSRRTRVGHDGIKSEKVEYQRTERSFTPRRDGEGRTYSRDDRQGGGQHFRDERQGSSYSRHERSGEGRPYHKRRDDSRQGEGRPQRSFDPQRKSFSRDGGSEGYHGKGAGARRNDFEGGGRGSYSAKGGTRKGGTKKSRYSFSERDEESINRILSGKPQLDNMNASDYDNAPTLAKDEMRLNKFIANSGICSRREADTLIQAGVVTVNGQVVTELGTKVNVFNDDVRFNGERVKGEEKVYIVMNKPKGFVTTTSDPHAEKTVMDLLKDCPVRVFPVGRLDKATTGVLMFTNDGEIAERLTHPSYDKKKIYQVILDHELKQEDYDKILAGVELSDGVIAADELSYIDENDRRKLGIEIHSGKNRIVRRIFESLGYDVRALDRVYFAGMTKKNLKKGQWRYLSDKEANMLKMGAYV